MPKAASCARTRSSMNAPLHCCSTSRSCASASAWMRELNRASKSLNEVVWREVWRAIASTMASRFFERCDSSRMMRRTCASRSSRSLSCCSNTRAVEASASSVRSASGRPVFENVIARRSISACVPCSICSIGRAIRRADHIASSRLSSVVAPPASPATRMVLRIGASNSDLSAASPITQPLSGEVTWALAMVPPSSDIISFQPCPRSVAAARNPSRRACRRSAHGCASAR